jgi:uncharacterized membrane protein YkoI
MKEVPEMTRCGMIIGVILAVLLTIGTVGLRAQQGDHTGSIRVQDRKEAGFVETAKISLNTAMNEALKHVQGKVLRVELENENGYLVYGVEIAKADRQIVDVKVDAGNGKILKIEQDDAEGHEEVDSENGHNEEGES